MRKKTIYKHLQFHWSKDKYNITNDWFLRYRGVVLLPLLRNAWRYTTWPLVIETSAWSHAVRLLVSHSVTRSFVLRNRRINKLHTSHLLLQHCNVFVTFVFLILQRTLLFLQKHPVLSSIFISFSVACSSRSCAYESTGARRSEFVRTQAMYSACQIGLASANTELCCLAMNSRECSQRDVRLMFVWCVGRVGWLRCWAIKHKLFLNL